MTDSYYDSTFAQGNVYVQRKENPLAPVIKAFLIMGIVVGAFFPISLAWKIPLTLTYLKKVKNGEPVSDGFKLCIFLFVSAIAGVLMIVADSKNDENRNKSLLSFLAKFYMVSGIIAQVFFPISLAWTIPMTLSYWKKQENGEPVGTAFKVLTLIFVDTTAGVLMLCDKSDNA